MRNLKKVLTLVLTVAMLLSVMVVGTGAAFSDQSSIKNTEAVDACVALNIIAGMEDGSYRPTNNVTRAQMCKMICVALNGGKEPTLGTNNTPTFSDVRTDPSSSWAESFIESCNSQGIVSGVGGGRFSPSGSVTGTQAARMLLVALGYRADQEGFTGDSWAISVNTLASAKGLYKGIESIDANSALSRDNAAQMIWNALNAYEVEYVSQLVTVNGTLTSKLIAQDKVVNAQGNKKVTMLEDKYEADTDEDGILYSVKEDSKGTYTVKTTKDTYTKVTKNYSDLLGQEVDVLVKNDDNSVVFGIYPTDNNSVALKTTAGQIDSLKTADKTLEVEGTKYNLEALNIVYDMGDNIDSVPGSSISSALVDASDNVKGNTSDAVYLVSNDGDNKIDVIIVITAQVAKVNYVGSDSITLSNGIGSIDEDDYRAYDGLAKGDYVLYTKEADGVAFLDTLEKISVVSGTIGAVKSGTDARIDGTYYKQGTNCTDVPKVNDKVNAAVYAGRYYDLDAVSEASSEDILFVAEAGKIQSGINSGVEAAVVFSDGTKSTVVIDDIVDPNNDENEKDASAVKVLSSSTKADYEAGTDGTVYVGAMYTYELDGSKYDITPLVNKKNDAGYDAVSTSATAYTESNDNPRLDGKRIDDNAIIFVAKDLAATGTSVKVIDGKELKTWNGNWGNITTVLSNTKNGVSTVMVASVSSTGESYGAETGNYGIITSDLETVKVNGTTYTSFNLWNGESDVPTVAKSSALNGAAKGSVVSFDSDGSEGDYQKIKNLAVQSAAAAMLGAEANGSKFDVTLTTSGASAAQQLYIADSDTTILFIDNKSGVKGGSLTDYAAMESSIDDIYVQNAIFVTRDGKSTELDLIVIDVRGKLALSSDLTVNGSASPKAEVNIANRTIVFPNGTTTITNDTVKGQFNNVLSAARITAGTDFPAKYTVISSDGSEYTFDVSIASAVTPPPAGE